MKRSKIRVVPTMHTKYGACWTVKEGDVSFGTFIDRNAAENKKLSMEKKKLEDFLLESTANQKLKIEENEK